MGKSQIKLVKKWLTNTDVNFSRISKTTGISRTTLYNYLNAKVDIRDKNFKSLTNYFNKGKEIDEMDTRYIIELQKEKINHLENKINQIENSESNFYGLTSEPIKCSYDIKIDWAGSVSVRYKANNEHIRLLAYKLGYSIDEMTEFLGVDQMIPYKIHPIHGLRTEKQKEYMLKSIKNYIKFFKNIELTTTAITADMPVTYLHKKGHEIHCLNTYTVYYLKGTGTCLIRYQS